MKRIWWIVIAVISMQSCSNEIDLYPDDVPSMYVVYGILDVNDSVQQIKVRKTFGGNSDSFLPNDNVRISVIGVSPNDSVVYDFWPKEYDKEFGFFPNESNPIHEATFTPQPGQKFKLILDDPELAEPITSSLETIATPRINHPFNGDAYYRFTDTINPFYFQFTATGQVHLQQFYVNYLEIMTNGDTVYQHSRFDLRPKFRDSTSVIRYYGKAFSLSYLFGIIRLQVNEDEDKGVLHRELHGFDYVVWAGDQVMKNYLQLAAQFPDNRKLFFSNVQNGFGYFAASSHSGVQNLYPTQEFFDTLVISPMTKDLKFKNRKFSGEFKREGGSW